MEKSKIQIELNNRPYSKGIFFVALTLRGGFITKNYILDDVRHFEGSCAFFNVLFRYLELSNEALGLHYDVQRAAATISFSAKHTDVIQKLNKVLGVLFDYEYNEDIFANAKKAAKDAFASRYKEGAFRSWYKGFEFSDLHKRFTLKTLISDIEQIDFNVFRSCAHALLVPGNVCIHASGEAEKVDFQELVLPPMDAVGDHSVRIAGYAYDPYLRQDAHITNIAREDHNLIIEAFDFLNPNVTNFTKLFLVELAAEQVPVRETEIWVDSLDASIMFASERLTQFKGQMEIRDAAAFARAKQRMLRKYALLSENNPEQFAIKAAILMSAGIYIDQYLRFADTCSYEMYGEILKKADCKITEAQIVLRKESK